MKFLKKFVIRRDSDEMNRWNSYIQRGWCEKLVGSTDKMILMNNEESKYVYELFNTKLKVECNVRTFEIFNQHT